MKTMVALCAFFAWGGVSFAVEPPSTGAVAPVAKVMAITVPPGDAKDAELDVAFHVEDLLPYVKDKTRPMTNRFASDTMDSLFNMRVSDDPDAKRVIPEGTPVYKALSKQAMAIGELEGKLRTIYDDVNRPERAKKQREDIYLAQATLLAGAVNTFLSACAVNLQDCSDPREGWGRPVTLFAGIRLTPYEKWVSGRVDELLASDTPGVTGGGTARTLRKVRFLNRLLLERWLGRNFKEYGDTSEPEDSKLVKDLFDLKSFQSAEGPGQP